MNRDAGFGICAASSLLTLNVSCYIWPLKRMQFSCIGFRCPLLGEHVKWHAKWPRAENKQRKQLRKF